MQEYDRFEQPSVLHERVEEPDNTRSDHTISATYDSVLYDMVLCVSHLICFAG